MGGYEIKQIKNTVLSIICQYDVDKVILFGSYAKGTPSPLSDIDIAIDGAVQGFDFFALLEDMNQAFVKDIDLIHLTEVDEDSKVMKAIQEGMVLYEREG